MTKEESSKTSRKWRDRRWGKTGDTVYGLGIVGALFYYIQHASTFGEGVVGVLKAILWPAFVVFKLLEFLKM